VRFKIQKRLMHAKGQGQRDAIFVDHYRRKRSALKELKRKNSWRRFMSWPDIRDSTFF